MVRRETGPGGGCGGGGCGGILQGDTASSGAVPTIPGWFSVPSDFISRYSSLDSSASPTRTPCCSPGCSHLRAFALAERCWDHLPPALRWGSAGPPSPNTPRARVSCKAVALTGLLFPSRALSHVVYFSCSLVNFPLLPEVHCQRAAFNLLPMPGAA